MGLEGDFLDGISKGFGLFFGALPAARAVGQADPGRDPKSPLASAVPAH